MQILQTLICRHFDADSWADLVTMASAIMRGTFYENFRQQPSFEELRLRTDWNRDDYIVLMYALYSSKAAIKVKDWSAYTVALSLESELEWEFERVLGHSVVQQFASQSDIWRYAHSSEIFGGDHLNQRNEVGATALHIAVQRGEYDATRMLLDFIDIDINIQSSTLESPLFVACKNGFLEIAQLLIDRPELDVFTINRFKSTALHASAQSGKLSIVKLLVARMRDDLETLERLKQWLNKLDGSSRTALEIAVQAGHNDIAEYLKAIGCLETTSSR